MDIEKMKLGADAYGAVSGIDPQTMQPKVMPYSKKTGLPPGAEAGGDINSLLGDAFKAAYAEKDLKKRAAKIADINRQYELYQAQSQG
jgi:hypothetical protein